ncbi:MAG: hypothetical protein Q7S20_09670 [Gemmatimonadaceae bacterium]|nr:hypothetical protein [Gemmatimonadaceae bacterium]
MGGPRRERRGWNGSRSCCAVIDTELKLIIGAGYVLGAVVGVFTFLISHLAGL